MSKVVACIIARTTSTRLPLKVLRDSGFGYSMLSLLIRRLKTVASIHEIYLCTSTEPVDDIMEDVAKQHGISIYRGSPDKVIERMIDVAELTNADILLRITGDNPLTSIEYINDQVECLRSKNLDYVRVVGVPLGATAEVIDRKALVKCYESMDPSVSEYLLLFIFDPERYKCGVIRISENDYSSYSVTVDTKDDYQRLLATTGHFSQLEQTPEKIRLNEIVDFYKSNPQLPALEVKNVGKVRLPYGKSIDFDEFNNDMKQRAKNSFNLNLS